MIKEVYRKWKFDITADRIGPDCPFTHWKLYFSSTRKQLCKSRFFSLGKNTDFRPGAYAINPSKIILGDNVIIRPNSMLFADPRGDEANIVIGDNVMLGSAVQIYTANHSFSKPGVDLINQGHCEVRPVNILQGAWIGAGSILLPGVSVGKNSVVAAGSVVTKDVPERCLFGGNPAKLIRKLN